MTVVEEISNRLDKLGVKFENNAGTYYRRVTIFGPKGSRSVVQCQGSNDRSDVFVVPDDASKTREATLSDLAKL